MKILKLPLLTLLWSAQLFAAEGFVEFCTGDRYLAKDFGDGNIAGHALIYVDGLCKDMDESFPQVKLCDDGDNHKGVGISLDSAFKNVKWMAVPTRELALFGDYGKGKVDKEVIQNIFTKAKEYKVFENIEFDESAFPKAIFEYTDDKIDQYNLYSIGTGIAFNTGRNMNCVKTKVGNDQLKNLTKFLNETNKSYYYSDKEYEWSMSDNCTHLSVNTLASAGIGKHRKVETKRGFIKNLFTLTLPKSEFLKLVRRVNKKTFKPTKIWKVKEYREFFEKYNRLPWSYGNLSAQYPIVKNNELFKTEGGSLFAFPTIGTSLKEAFEAQNSDEITNLQVYKEAISKALDHNSFDKSYNDQVKNDFFIKYQLYLEAQLLEIQNKLEGK